MQRAAGIKGSRGSGHAILFDGEDVQHFGDLDALRVGRLGGSKLLWIDLDTQSELDSAEVVDFFELDSETAQSLATPNDRAVFSDHGRYIHITTYAPRDDPGAELQAVECVVGKNWVVTAHDKPIAVLDEFASRVSGSGDTGTLDGPCFLAALLDWVLSSYTAAFERMEQRLEEFDVHAMRGEGADEDIETLIEMRLQVGKLRRALASHRSALVALTHPELEALGNDDSAERFKAVFHRYESTLQEARDAREAIVGSFDVLIARGAHRTNQIMTVLTLASVILLPGALLAGVMGMNFNVGLFRYTWLFWAVLAVIAAIGVLAIVLAKRRRWI